MVRPTKETPAPMTGGVLALDLGTSMVKAVLVSPNGEVLHAGQVPVPRGEQGVVDTLPLWDLVAEAIQQVLASVGGAEHVQAVIATGQGDGLWMLDKEGKPLPQAFLWNSNAGAHVVAQWADDGSIDSHFRATGTVLWSGSQAALWRWFSESQSKLASTVSAVMCAKDLVNYLLCGERATDVTDASIPFLRPGTTTYSFEAAEKLGCGPLIDLLPAVRQPGELLGTVSPLAAQHTGLRAGTPVHVGALDVVAMLWGSGQGEIGDVFAVLGTTALTASVTPRSAFDGDPVGASISLPDDSKSLRAMGSSSGTATLEWFLKLHGFTGDERYENFWKEVDASHGGDEIFLPYLAGERAPFLAPHATGSFLGLTSNSTVGSMGRAVVEGITMAMCLGMDFSLPEVNARESTIVLAGGGSLSPQWAQMVSNVSGKTVIVDGRAHLGALGVAGLILDGTGEIATTREIAISAFSPDSNHPALLLRYAVFQEAIRAVSPLWGHTSASKEESP